MMFEKVWRKGREAAGHIALAVRMLLFHFHQLQDPSHWNGPSTNKVSFPISINLICIIS